MWKFPSNVSGRAPRLVLPCDPALAADRLRITQAAAAFRAAHPDGLIVSVTPETDALRSLGIEIVSARDLLPYASFLSLWARGYRLADGLLKRASPELAHIIRPFYHGMADLALQALLVQATLQLIGGPLLLLPLPGATGWYHKLALEILPTPWWLRQRLILRACRHFAQEIRRRCSLRRKHSASKQAAGVCPAVVIIVDDGVSGVNFPSAEAIADELASLDRAVVVLTSDPNVRRAFESRGVAVCFCGAPRLAALKPAVVARWRAAARDLRRLRREPTCGLEERVLADLTADRLLAFCAFGFQIESLLSTYHHRHGPIGAGLAVNEGKPAAVAALAWLAAHDLPDVGYWPALLGKRADSTFFPASRHLVYGDQLRDLMITVGIRAQTIETVGSVNFDRALGRELQHDRAYVYGQVLEGRLRREKLVVVATEALPNPFDEIAPVLDALAARPEVEIVLKLHPADSRKLYADYLAEHRLAERVLLVESCDVDAMLHAADLLVCVLSNIIVRAAMLGTPTLVCDFSSKRQPLDFVALGLAVGCFSARQVAPMIHDLIADGPARHAVIAQLERTVLRFCHSTDGKSAKRVGTYMHSLVAPSVAVPA